MDMGTLLDLALAAAAVVAAGFAWIQKGRTDAATKEFNEKLDKLQEKVVKPAEPKKPS